MERKGERPQKPLESTECAKIGQDFPPPTGLVGTAPPIIGHRTKRAWLVAALQRKRGLVKKIYARLPGLQPCTSCAGSTPGPTSNQIGKEGRRILPLARALPFFFPFFLLPFLALSRVASSVLFVAFPVHKYLQSLLPFLPDQPPLCVCCSFLVKQEREHTCRLADIFNRKSHYAIVQRVFRYFYLRRSSPCWYLASPPPVPYPFGTSSALHSLLLLLTYSPDHPPPQDLYLTQTTLQIDCGLFPSLALPSTTSCRLVENLLLSLSFCTAVSPRIHNACRRERTADALRQGPCRPHCRRKAGRHAAAVYWYVGGFLSENKMHNRPCLL